MSRDAGARASIHMSKAPIPLGKRVLRDKSRSITFADTENTIFDFLNESKGRLREKQKNKRYLRR